MTPGELDEYRLDELIGEISEAVCSLDPFCGNGVIVLAINIGGVRFYKDGINAWWNCELSTCILICW